MLWELFSDCVLVEGDAETDGPVSVTAIATAITESSFVITTSKGSSQLILMQAGHEVWWTLCGSKQVGLFERTSV